MDVFRILLGILYFLLICAFVPMDVYIDASINASFPPSGHILISIGPFLGLMRFRVLRRNLGRGPEPRGGAEEKRPPHRKGPAGRFSGRPRELLAFMTDLLRNGGIMIREFCVDMMLGTGDAASTGMAIGAIWAAISPMISIVMKALPRSTAPPRIRIAPDFQTARLEGSFHCIARLNPGYIILRGGSFGIRYVLGRILKRRQVRG